MSKKADAANYENVTPQLIEQVKAVLADAEKHTYSVSKVYGAYNTALGKNDKPETCASCLRIRVDALKKWLKDAPKDLKTEAAKNEKTVEPTYQDVVTRLGIGSEWNGNPESEYATLGTVLGNDYPTKLSEAEKTVVQARADELYAGLVQYDNPEGNYYAAPVEGANRYAMAEGLPLDFMPGADDASKGTVTYADGSKVKAGTYEAADGTKLVAQANGNARVEVIDLT